MPVKTKAEILAENGVLRARVRRLERGSASVAESLAEVGRLGSRSLDVGEVAKRIAHSVCTLLRNRRRPRAKTRGHGPVRKLLLRLARKILRVGGDRRGNVGRRMDGKFDGTTRPKTLLVVDDEPTNTEHTDARFTHGICPECRDTIVTPSIARMRSLREEDRS